MLVYKEKTVTDGTVLVNETFTLKKLINFVDKLKAILRNSNFR